MYINFPNLDAKRRTEWVNERSPDVWFNLFRPRKGEFYANHFLIKQNCKSGFTFHATQNNN